jgi:hypothetical protein
VELDHAGEVDQLLVDARVHRAVPHLIEEHVELPGTAGHVEEVPPRKAIQAGPLDPFLIDEQLEVHGFAERRQQVSGGRRDAAPDRRQRADEAAAKPRSERRLHLVTS